MAATLKHTEFIGEARAASPALRLLLCAASAALAACLMLPSVASAEVRRADVIKGETVEARGLTVAQCPSIDALYACVMDEDGTVYFERDATSPTQIASVTKIMTGVVALDAVDQGLVSLTDHVIVSAAAAEVGESSAGLQEGDMLTLQDALYALLVPSGNDAAVTIAEYVGQALIDANGGGGDAVTAFCDAMNAKAAELGCVDTVYRNPHGLDDGEWTGDQHSCAADQAKVVQCAMLNERHRAREHRRVPRHLRVRVRRQDRLHRSRGTVVRRRRQQRRALLVRHRHPLQLRSAAFRRCADPLRVGLR